MVTDTAVQIAVMSKKTQFLIVTGFLWLMVAATTVDGLWSVIRNGTISISERYGTAAYTTHPLTFLFIIAVHLVWLSGLLAFAIYLPKLLKRIASQDALFKRKLSGPQFVDPEYSATVIDPARTPDGQPTS